MMNKVKGKFYSGPLHLHVYHSKGRKLEYGFALIPDQGLPPAKSLSEKMARESLAMLMDGLGSDVVDKLLSQNSSMSAESLLQSPDMEKKIEWQKCVEQYQREQADKAAIHVHETGTLSPPEPAGQEATPSVEIKEIELSKETAGKGEAELSQEMAAKAEPVEAEQEYKDELPDANDEPEGHCQKVPVWEIAFKHLVLPPSITQTLSTVKEDVFWNLHSFASARDSAVC